MKQFFSWYVKGIATFTLSLFMLLFAATKTNAQWVELGGASGSPFYARINSLATDISGNVYAGGFFTNASGHHYVAKWNGTAWSELSGTNGFVFNYIISSVATDASGNVYAGGESFDTGVNNIFVAKWDGTAWSELGGINGSFNGDIYSIATDASGNVYAGGQFKDVNGNFYVAKWDGTAWSELGSPNGSFINTYYYGAIESIATDTSGNVYAAGGFTDANGIHYVAKWDGTAWGELGGADNTPFNGAIATIATDAGGNVYAGGYFTDANDKHYVAEWNGTTWSEPGGANGAFNDNIFRLTTDVGGNVYAGGDFTNTVGKQYVAKWDGTVWSKLGDTNSSSFNGSIYGITTDANGNVYAGGNLTIAGDNTYVAEFTQNVLPVTLISITATKEKNGVAINWQTATETNSSHFTVQRSTGGNSFADIGTVKAAGSGANNYQFIDNHPANGINYYRLQSVDKDGSFTYSPVRTINEAIRFSANLYLNPVQNHLSLNFNSDKAKTVQVQIVNSEGKVMATQQIQVAAGTSTQNINIASLSNGSYYVRCITADGESKLKFVKE